MLTPGELAAHFALAHARVRGGQLTHETLVVLEHVANDARHMIGREVPEWASLAPSTVEEKERLGYVGQISATDPLLRTGELRGSIEAVADQRGSAVEGAVASNSKVALYQEVGTSRIPARPFLAGALIQSQYLFEEAMGQFGVKLLMPGTRYYG